MVPVELVAFSFILFCLGIYAVGYVITEAFEAFLPQLIDKKNKSPWRARWHTFFRPSIFITLGALCGNYVIQYPYPDILINDFDNPIYGRLFYGIAAGFLCVIVAPGIKKLLSLQFAQNIADSVSKIIKSKKNGNE